MIAIWQLVLKSLGTSFLAFLAVGIIIPLIKLLLTKTWFNDILTKNKGIVKFILLLVFFSIPLVLSLITRQDFVTVLIMFIGELIFSVIIVVTVWITWAFAENSKEAKKALLVTLLRVLVNVEQRNYLRVNQFLSSDEKALDFFVIEYWYLRKILSEPMLSNCLNICQISIQDPPIEQDLKFYDINNPSDFRVISLEDHALVISPETTEADFQNYNVTEELSALQNLSNWRVASSDR
jgi:hypothetical protein